MTTLNKSQQAVLKAVDSHRNLFITGGAGVGKTYTVLSIIEYLSNSGKNVMVTAPTGIAALSIGGVTLSRAFEIPFGALTYRVADYKPNDELVKSDVVIIDEISMCRWDTFDFIANKILQADEIRKYQGLKPIQLIVVGDFFQLPPVTTYRDKRALDRYYNTDVGLAYAFMSKFWKMFDFYSILLTEVMRQIDKEYIQELDKIRTGNKAYIELLKEKTSPNKIDKAVEICSKNSEVKEKNKEELEKIPQQAYEYKALITGDASESDVIADEELILKVGARVMTLINNDVMKNGALGTVEELLRDKIIVKLDTGERVELERFTWEVYNYRIDRDEQNEQFITKYISGTFTQFPVKLAYAITIHKSQGQTYDSANISPYCWECGQLYVAISRVRSIENVHFNYAPDSSYVCTSLNVIKFYNDLNFNATIDVQNTEEKALDSDAETLLKLLKTM